MSSVLKSHAGHPRGLQVLPLLVGIICSLCPRFYSLFHRDIYFILFIYFAPPPFSLGLHLQRVKVPRLGVDRSCSCWPTPQPQQLGVRGASSTYTTAHGITGSLTH